VIRDVNFSQIRIFSIPDPGVKKASDPGSETLLSIGFRESIQSKRSGPGSPTVSIKRDESGRTLVSFGLVNDHGDSGSDRKKSKNFLIPGVVNGQQFS
jgi:hypothetical protein